jgi:hypothetical protein
VKKKTHLNQRLATIRKRMRKGKAAEWEIEFRRAFISVRGSKRSTAEILGEIRKARGGSTLRYIR